MLKKHQLELLSPARDVSIAKEAILHGADAVYIGGPSFGARHNAANSVADIAGLVEFARLFHAKVFVTLNTILHDDEVEPARALIHELYNAGVDALIVQDMGVLEMDIPPIELHASTQCDIRRLDKAKFLSQAGFSQIVLARELNLQEIRTIADNVDAAVEFFIHGALCVAFSGQCNISHAQTGRSANRGDCSQACRLPYTLKDDKGRVVAYDKHLLSMKDNNQTDNLHALVDAGVRSFKIEGRYKDVSYVKNITAHYRKLLDEILTERPELARASSGYTEHFFAPNPEKTFHRGSTDYFVTNRQIDIGAFDSPKFVGLPVGELIGVGKQDLTVQTDTQLTNGDGLNVLVKREVVGFRVNNVYPLCDFDYDGKHVWQYRVVPNEMPADLNKLRLPLVLNRNLDHNWQQALLKTSAERRVLVNWQIDSRQEQLTATVTSEDGSSVSASLPGPFEAAKNTEKSLQQLQDTFAQLGNTIYHAEQVNIAGDAWFVPGSLLKTLRRDLIEQLTAARIAAYPRGFRKAVSDPAPVYPDTQLSFLDNVYNEKAREFYKRFGVQLIEAAFEAHEETGDVPVMITKHCLRFSFNLCPKQAKGVTGVITKVSDMQLVHGDEVLTLKFDCKPCEMHVVGKIKPHIFNGPQPGSVESGVGFFDPANLIMSSRD
ncbi:peptidase U32 family protein [Parathalassolituus penaei]|uniref:U32 family peptidase n=1 Tax=Parathalassolituus penaei TaxID=2997323 RepID=A0A9X3EC26_9GAMM|nr:U32 family peptidase [Parathalassolituus penaei]MCY0964814.1 U32 family peptidase [Parathalassolituus penaei]